MSDAHGDAPRRSHSIVLKAGGDTAEDLARELEGLAFNLRAGRLTVGCGGGPTNSSIYSYSHAPEQTHDSYFREVDAWLAARRDGA